MILILQIVGLIGLVLFIVFGLIWLFSAPRRAQYWPIAVVGLLIWAIATVIITLDTLL